MRTITKDAIYINPVAAPLYYANKKIFKSLQGTSKTIKKAKGFYPTDLRSGQELTLGTDDGVLSIPTQ